MTSNGVLVGAGTSAVTTSKQAPAGAFVGTTDTQTLTNKVITDTTNTVAANSLKSATTLVAVSSATAPSNGQVLTATSSTTATWQSPTGNIASLNSLTNPNLFINSSTITVASSGTNTVLLNIPNTYANSAGYAPDPGVYIIPFVSPSNPGQWDYADFRPTSSGVYYTQYR